VRLFRVINGWKTVYLRDFYHLFDNKNWYLLISILIYVCASFLIIFLYYLKVWVLNFIIKVLYFNYNFNKIKSKTMVRPAKSERDCHAPTAHCFFHIQRFYAFANWQRKADKCFKFRQVLRIIFIFMQLFCTTNIQTFYKYLTRHC